MIVVVPIAGLCNRINAVDLAVDMSERFNTEVKILWNKTKELNCAWCDMFLPIKENKVELIDKSHYPLLYHVPNKRNLYIPKFLQKIKFDIVVYAEEYLDLINNNYDFSQWKNKNVYTTTWAALYNDCKRFDKIKLNSELSARYEREREYLPHNCIGVHIRRTDHSWAIKYSPIEMFVTAMNKEIEKDGSVCFYLASDDMETKTYLKNIFGERVITDFKETSRSDVAGMQDAVIQLWLLGSCRKVLGSYNSSFSYVASLRNNCELVIIKQ